MSQLTHPARRPPPLLCLWSVLRYVVVYFVWDRVQSNSTASVPHTEVGTCLAGDECLCLDGFYYSLITLLPAHMTDECWNISPSVKEVNLSNQQVVLAKEWRGQYKKPEGRRREAVVQ